MRMPGYFKDNLPENSTLIRDQICEDFPITQPKEY